VRQENGRVCDGRVVVVVFAPFNDEDLKGRIGGRKTTSKNTCCGSTYNMIESVESS